MPSLPRRRLAVLATLAALLAVAGPARLGAQAARPVADTAGGPRGAMLSYLAALRTGEYARAARLMHPEALETIGTLARVLLEREAAGALAAPLFDGMTADSLRVAPDTVLFARMLKATMERDPKLRAAMASTVAEPIGDVREASSGTTYVVYRLRMSMDDRLTLTKVEVMSMRQHDGRWRLLLPGDMQMLVDMFGGMARRS